MVKLLLPLLLAFVTSFIHAQTDTTYFYFDKDWKSTAKASAVFYGKKFKQGNGWRRQDFWVATNIMQMDGFFTDSVTRDWEGTVKYYTETGELDDSSYYENKTEKSKYLYYPGHKLKAYVIFNPTGQVTEQKGYDETGAEMPGYIFQKEAVFPGGIEAWQKYLVSGLERNLPKAYRKGNIWGVVTIAFLVLKDGTVGEVKVDKSSGYPELDEHAVQIITNSPKWIPAIQYNKNVIYRQKQQITYPQPQ